MEEILLSQVETDERKYVLFEFAPILRYKNQSQKEFPVKYNNMYNIYTMLNISAFYSKKRKLKMDIYHKLK